MSMYGFESISGIWTLYTFIGISLANFIDLDHSIGQLYYIVPEAKHRASAEELTQSGSSHLLFILHYYLPELIMLAFITALAVRRYRGSFYTSLECLWWGFGIGFGIHSFGDRISAFYRYSAIGHIITAGVILLFIFAIAYDRWKWWSLTLIATIVCCYIVLTGFMILFKPEFDRSTSESDVIDLYRKVTPICCILLLLVTCVTSALLHWLDTHKLVTKSPSII